MGPHFPSKCAKSVRLSSIFEPPGILKRIYRICRIRRKRSQARQNRPWVPHAGGQDDGSLHKLPQMSPKGPISVLAQTHTNKDP